LSPARAEAAAPRYWGEDGFFRIIRGDSALNGGIEDQVTGSPTGATWTKASEL